MAQKRMIDKKISVSEQVANLPVEAQLIFTWSIPHADDVGLLPRSPRTLKAIVVPMWDITTEDFGKHVDSIIKQGLYHELEFEGAKYLYVKKFSQHQTLKKDRQPQTLLNITIEKDPKTTWQTLGDILESLGIQLEDTGFQVVTEVKRSEVKRSKEKKEPYAQTEFERFWSEYPNKKSKQQAIKAWNKLKPNKKLIEKMMTSLKEHRLSDQWLKDDGQYIPHPSTWLNQSRWEDELKPASRGRKVDQF